MSKMLSRLLPPAVLGLLVANGVVFLLQDVEGYKLEGYFALWPLGGPYWVRINGHVISTQFHIWQVVSYSFLHGSALHLFSNLFALWMFGKEIENSLGTARFLGFYFICVVTAAFVQLLVMYVGNCFGGLPLGVSLGASGGVFGILLAFGMMFPNERVILLFLPIPIPAKLFVVLYGAFELFAGLTGTISSIGHFAHLGGMIGGFLTIQYWRRRWPFRQRSFRT